MNSQTPQSELRSLLQLLAQGERSVEDVHQQLISQSFPENTAAPSEAPAGELRIDLERAGRCGFPEVIYAPGKSTETLIEAFQSLLENQQDALATRCEPDQAKALCDSYPQAIQNVLGRTVRISHDENLLGKVVIVTAGTSDRPVAEEALETLHWMHVDAELLMDLGIAGPQRLLEQKHRLQDADAIIVVAGMEGALPSVVAGWVACPVIAVPTSVGYGAAFGGLSALLGMLNSCAANVAVVNIDAGFKAAYLSGMIARQSQRRS